MLNRRIVVTGIGIISPLGISYQESWDNLLKGKSGIIPIESFDTSKVSCKIAGIVNKDPVSGFNPINYIEAKELCKMDYFIQLGMSAAISAIEDSGWKPTDELLRERTGVIIGSGIGGLNLIEETSIRYNNLPDKRISPYFIPASLINLVSGHVSIKYGFSGPNHSVATACATGTHAIGDACRIIKYDDADVMIAGGTEAAITPVGIAGFLSAKALSTNFNNEPHRASRPWDKGRDGFVMGEGAGVVVLEEYKHAKKRGAHIYAEIIGYGLSGDAYHITSTHPEGRGAFKCMNNALRDAKITPADINYINAHGTSTPIGDSAELFAVQKMFLETNNHFSMSSTKSSTGHLLGAAGGVELIFSILALRDQVVPATLNLEDPIDEVKIDLVPLIPKKKKIKYVLSNSFGFGGTNASLVYSGGVNQLIMKQCFIYTEDIERVENICDTAFNYITKLLSLNILQKNSKKDKEAY